MKFASRTIEGDAVYASPAQRRHFDGRSLGDDPARRRARDMAWVLLARDGWTSGEIEGFFDISKDHIRDRVNAVLEFGKQEPIRWPKRRGRAVDALMPLRDRTIAVMASFGLTPHDLADIWGLSRQRISQILLELKN